MNKQLWIAGLAAMILLAGCGGKTGKGSSAQPPQDEYEALVKSLHALYEQYDKGEVTEAEADSIMDEILNAMWTLNHTAVGDTYIDIAAPTPEGDTLRLSELVGVTDYVLVDFWATWCGPCRASLPALKQLYKDLPAGRLEILGVSLDNSEEKWASFIKDQQLVWRHISDLQGWGSAPAAVYGVNSIPATVLIDRNGMIVARNASEEELRSIIVEANLTR